jgi:hypothetical protein
MKSCGLRNNSSHDSGTTSEESKYWKFHHEKFQLGRPDLLSQIRKHSSEPVVDKQDVEQLKSEIGDLKDAFMTVNDDVAKLKALVECLVKSHDASGQKHSIQFAEVASKRRLVVMGSDGIASVLLGDSQAQAVKYVPSKASSDNGVKGMLLNAVGKSLDDGPPLSVTSETSLPPLSFHSSGPNIINRGQLLSEWLDAPSIKLASSSLMRNGSIGAASIDEDVWASLLAFDHDDDFLFAEL